MNCNKCNALLTENDTICPKCGAEIKKNYRPLIIALIITLVLLIGIIVLAFFIPKLRESNPDIVIEKEEKNTTEDTIIGNDDFGYLKLPGKWYKFQDVDGKSALQYSLDSVWIVSLESYESKYDDETAENLAKASLYNLINNEVGVENATGATVKLAGYDAYQVYGLYTSDNIWLVEWFFEPGDGKIHYISVEGPDYNSDYFNIPETFSLTKIK